MITRDESSRSEFLSNKVDRRYREYCAATKNYAEALLEAAKNGVVLTEDEKSFLDGICTIDGFHLCGKTVHI
jgi:hypothetical protein